ncbi:MAG: hypothetical protein L0Y72_09840 [Gemmataceae bacterium]|nr:hypothetical protein [Gemmataceae bacterium]MCI0739333.1 hypothetical protein [Gemmataceae bacterium]
MNPRMRTVFLTLCISIAHLSTAFGQAKPQAFPSKEEKKQIEEIEQRLTQVIKTDGISAVDTPLVEMLKKIESRMSKEKKVSLRIDEKAFAKDLPEAAKTSVRLPLYPKVMTLYTALRVLVSQIPTNDGDYVIGPSGVTITTFKAGAHTKEYDVRDLVREAEFILPSIRRRAASTWAGNDWYDLEDIGPNDGAALLVRLIHNDLTADVESRVQVLNGTVLRVFTGAAGQRAIASRLDDLRHLADVAVVMNASLYEVDQEFYAKEIAPLFKKTKEGKEPSLVPITQSLVEKVKKQKLVQNGEQIKVRSGQRVDFLSHQRSFDYVPSPGNPAEQQWPMHRTGLEGVAFQVEPTICPDRHSLVLKIVQRISQLVGINKAKVLDRATGKQLELDSPNLRKSSLSGTIEIDDGQPILMAVDYRPPDAKDRRCVLLAEPMLYIEEEQRQIREAAKDAAPEPEEKKVDEPKKEIEPLAPDPPPKQIPLSEDAHEILQATVNAVLTDPELKRDREFYGTPGDTRFALVDGQTFAWPKWFNPSVTGFEVDRSLSTTKCTAFKPRLLGIRLDKFDLTQKKAGHFDAPIEVVIFNAGGSANGGVIGGNRVYYLPRKMGKKWVAEFAGSIDP